MSDIFMVRQPIFNESLRVIGYEIMVRHNHEHVSEDPDPSDDTLSLLGNTLLVSGLEKLAAGKKAFITFGKNVLGSEFSFKLPPQSTAIKIDKNIIMNDAELQHCKKLHDKGYTIVFDELIFKQTTLSKILIFLRYY